MSDSIDIPGFTTIAAGLGKIRFHMQGGRAWDERGHKMFAVQLPTRPLLYGEWQPLWAQNSDDFDIEVLDIGLPDDRNIGNPAAIDRHVFTAEERTLIEQLVRTLFTSEATRADNYLLRERNTDLHDRVIFRAGWIRV